MTTKREPAKRFRIGRIVASVWKNETKNGTLHSATFERFYRKEGAEQFSYSDSFARDDLLTLAKIADQAHSWIVEQDKSDEK